MEVELESCGVMWEFPLCSRIDMNKQKAQQIWLKNHKRRWLHQFNDLFLVKETPSVERLMET